MLDYSAFTSGLSTKLANATVYDFGADTGSLFPNITSQQKWHVAKDQGHVHLSDGMTTYSFHLPGGMSPKADFLMTKVQDIGKDKFDALPKIRAQVHRADPGSIYFTLQEGANNPTYTFKHTSGTEWKGIPKVKKIEKQAGMLAAVPDWIAQGVMAPGFHPWRNTALAGLAGAGYHFGRKYLYNTKEENKEQDNLQTFLKRTLLPAGAVGIYSHAMDSMFGDGPIRTTKMTGTFPGIQNSMEILAQAQAQKAQAELEMAKLQYGQK